MFDLTLQIKEKYPHIADCTTILRIECSQLCKNDNNKIAWAPLAAFETLSTSKEVNDGPGKVLFY